jgi:hypothetical protein
LAVTVLHDIPISARMSQFSKTGFSLGLKFMLQGLAAPSFGQFIRGLLVGTRPFSSLLSTIHDPHCALYGLSVIHSEKCANTP